jgi:uncharacterized protein YcaQ
LQATGNHAAGAARGQPFVLRNYGYYVLPILEESRFTGRVDEPGHFLEESVV